MGRRRHPGGEPALERTAALHVCGAGRRGRSLDREQIAVRLSNADGDGTPQKIRFAFPLSKVEQTDLNGNATAACAIRKRGGVSEIEVAMPRFGLKTLRLTK